MKNVGAKKNRFCAFRTRGICGGNRTGCYFSHATLVPLQSCSVLQVTRVKRVALAEVACLVAAAEPAGALFGRPVRK